MPQAISAIYTFTYGALGSMAINSYNTPMANQAVDVMVNFVPRMNGTVTRRRSITRQSIGSSYDTWIRDVLNLAGTRVRQMNAFRIMTHTLAADKEHTILCTGDLQKQDGSFYTGEAISVTTSLIRYVDFPYKYEYLQDLDVHYGSSYITITHPEVPAHFIQYVKIGPTYEESLAVHKVDWQRGPCEDPNEVELCYAMYVTPNMDPKPPIPAVGAEIKIEFFLAVGEPVPPNLPLADDLIGGVFAFEHPLAPYDVWQAGPNVNYAVDDFVSHEGNVYRLVQEPYMPRIGALPPTHYEVGEVGAYGGGDLGSETPPANNPLNKGYWLYVNSGTGYAKLKSVETPMRGVFELQQELPINMVWRKNPTYDSDRLWRWRVGSECKRFGHFAKNAIFANRTYVGGGRDIDTMPGVVDFSMPINRNSLLIASSILKADDLCIDTPDITGAQVARAATAGGSAIYGIRARDTNRLVLITNNGMSLLGDQSTEESVDVTGSANLALNNQSQLTIHNGQMCVLSVDRRKIFSIQYDMQVDYYLATDLLANNPDIVGDSYIKRMISVENSPAQLVCLRGDGKIFVRYMTKNNEKHGFYEIDPHFPVCDICPHNVGGKQGIKLLCGIPSDANNATSPFNDIEIGSLILEPPESNEGYVDWVGGPSRSFRSYMKISNFVLPGGVTQGVRMRASNVNDVIVNTSKGSGKINGSYFGGSAGAFSTLVPLHRYIFPVNTALEIESIGNNQLDIINLEVNYTVNEAIGGR